MSTNTINQTTGSLYAETAEADITDIARLIRADIKAAIKAGDLPTGTYRARCERYSMGQSITVTATVAGPDRVPSTDPRSCMFGKDADFPYGLNNTATVEQIEIERKLQAIVDQYNRVRSDVLSDYHNSKFFGFVQIKGTES